MAVAPREQRGLFVTKPVDALVADTEDSAHQLRRAVGALDLTALGLGAIIGTGIFVVIGEAIGDAGPAIILSFVLAGVTCAFSALAFAELASTVPVAGSTFTLPAVVIVLAITAVLCVGIRESARANSVMVVVKLLVLALFLALGVTAFTGDNVRPFAPQGVDGVVTAASVIFFAYIGFDAVSTSGEETKNPSRDLPIAIVGSLAIATLLYIAVAVVAVGALPFDQLRGAEAPLAKVLDEGAGY